MTQAFDRSQLAEPDGDGHDHHDDDGDADADQVGSRVGLEPPVRPGTGMRAVGLLGAREQPLGDIHADRPERPEQLGRPQLPRDFQVYPPPGGPHPARTVAQQQLPLATVAQPGPPWRRDQDDGRDRVGPAGWTSMAVPPPPGSPGVRPEPGTVPATAGAAGAAGRAAGPDVSLRLLK